MMIRYCVNCDDERALREEVRRHTLVIKGKRIEFDAEVAVCQVCGEVVASPDYDDAALRKAYDLYRKQQGLLTSEEIVTLRKRYGLSQRALARLLGWGLVTIQRYEKGVIQDRAHDQVLRSLFDPRRVLALLGREGDDLTPGERECLRRKAQEIFEKERAQWTLADVARELPDQQPNVYNGWRRFDVLRFATAVSWFATRVENLVKTKLAKLLWLADFKHFRDFGVSITGVSYARLPHGPAPDKFGLLLSHAAVAGVIELEEAEFGEYIGDMIRPLTPLDETLFDEHETATFEYILRRFGRHSAKRLSELSHQENAWLERANGELIPYDEAPKLRIFEGSSQ